MCWTCNINKLEAQIAKEDINVYKVVIKAAKNFCISPFRRYEYYSKDIQPSLALKITVEPYSAYAKITEGYYSYSSVNFVCDSINTGIDGKLAKAIQCGYHKEIFSINNPFYLATFIIPVGSVYFTNEDGVIVSNKIRYTGKYIKL